MGLHKPDSPKLLMAVLVLTAFTYAIVVTVTNAAERQSPDAPYSLEQIIALTMERNRTLAANRNKLDASDWNVRKAYSEFLPKVSITQRFTRVDDFSVQNANFAVEGVKSIPGFEDIEIPPILFKDTYQTGLSVTVPIYNGGRLTGNLKLAKMVRETDWLALKDAEAEIMLQVVIEYFTYAKNREFVHARKVALNLAQKNLKNAKAKNEQGLRPKSDILRWEAQVATEESSLIEAENALAIARVSLANLAGIDLLEDFNIEEIPETEFVLSKERYAKIVKGDPQEQLNRLYTGALQNNAGRQMAALQTDVSRNSERIARSRFFPQINFEYNYSWQGNDTPSLDGFKSWYASIQMSYELFSGLGDYSEVQKARAEIQQSEHSVQEYERNMMVSIFSAFNTIKSALARITLFEKNLIQAQDNLRIINNRYNLGLASNIDLIDAQVLETTAHVNLITSRYDLLIAGAELERTVGSNLE